MRKAYVEVEGSSLEMLHQSQAVTPSCSQTIMEDRGSSSTMGLFMLVFPKLVSGFPNLRLFGGSLGAPPVISGSG